MCLWVRKEGGIVVGFLDKGERDGGFFWFIEDVVVEKEIRNVFVWNDVYKKYWIVVCNWVYVVENVNGDICFLNKIVDIYDLNICYCFFYLNLIDGEINFLFFDICIDNFGYILIVD